MLVATMANEMMQRRCDGLSAGQVFRSLVHLVALMPWMNPTQASKYEGAQNRMTIASRRSLKSIFMAHHDAPKKNATHITNITQPHARAARFVTTLTICDVLVIAG